MSYFYDLVRGEVRVETTDELKLVVGELNGQFHNPPTAVRVNTVDKRNRRKTANSVDDSVDDNVNVATLTHRHKRRKMSATQRAGLKRSQREAKAISKKHGVTIIEAYQIRREIAEGKRTTTGRLRKAK